MFSIQETVKQKGGEVTYFESGIGERVRNINKCVALLRFRTGL